MATRLRTNNISRYVMKQEPKRGETENLPAQKQKENERKMDMKAARLQKTEMASAKMINFLKFKTNMVNLALVLKHFTGSFGCMLLLWFIRERFHSAPNR